MTSTETQTLPASVPNSYLFSVPPSLLCTQPNNTLAPPDTCLTSWMVLLGDSNGKPSLFLVRKCCLNAAVPQLRQWSCWKRRPSGALSAWWSTQEQMTRTVSIRTLLRQWGIWLSRPVGSSLTPVWWSPLCCLGQTPLLMSSMTLIWRSEDDVPPYLMSTFPSSQPLAPGTSMMDLQRHGPWTQPFHPLLY